MDGGELKGGCRNGVGGRGERREMAEEVGGGGMECAQRGDGGPWRGGQGEAMGVDSGLSRVERRCSGGPGDGK